jgi:TonB family protein
MVLAMTPATYAQDSVARARDLYRAAAYGEALEMLTRLEESLTAGEHAADGQRRSIRQYRVFCLLALGRVEEADRAIESIVMVDPFFGPSPDEVSPHVRDVFVGVRRRLLPLIVRRDYAAARTAFDRQNFEAAAVGFKRVLDLLGDAELAAVAAEPPLPDFGTLSAGFYALSLTTPDAPPAEPVAETAPPATRPVYDVTDDAVVAPVTIVQVFPSYQRGALEGRSGVLEIVIDEDGLVESAVMRATISAAYDRRVIEATTEWRYEPATRGGVPVKFVKRIEITAGPGR